MEQWRTEESDPHGFRVAGRGLAPPGGMGELGRAGRRSDDVRIAPRPCAFLWVEVVVGKYRFLRRWISSRMLGCLCLLSMVTR